MSSNCLTDVGHTEESLWPMEVFRLQNNIALIRNIMSEKVGLLVSLDEVSDQPDHGHAAISCICVPGIQLDVSNRSTVTYLIANISPDVPKPDFLHDLEELCICKGVNTIYACLDRDVSELSWRSGIEIINAWAYRIFFCPPDIIGQLGNVDAKNHALRLPIPYAQAA